jgi:outer membrane receptor protein involved in Fe transport
MLEAGFKWQSDLFDVYATAFQTKFENIRFNDSVFNSTTNSFTTRVAYGDTNTVGLELEGIIRPVEWADLSAALSWQNPEYDTFRFTENVGGATIVTEMDVGPAKRRRRYTLEPPSSCGSDFA